MPDNIGDTLYEEGDIIDGSVVVGDTIFDNIQITNPQQRVERTNAKDIPVAAIGRQMPKTLSATAQFYDTTKNPQALSGTKITVEGTSFRITSTGLARSKGESATCPVEGIESVAADAVI